MKMPTFFFIVHYTFCVLTLTRSVSISLEITPKLPSSSDKSDVLQNEYEYEYEYVYEEDSTLSMSTGSDASHDQKKESPNINNVLPFVEVDQEMLQHPPRSLDVENGLDESNTETTSSMTGLPHLDVQEGDNEDHNSPQRALDALSSNELQENGRKKNFQKERLLQNLQNEIQETTRRISFNGDRREIENEIALDFFDKRSDDADEPSELLLSPDDKNIEGKRSNTEFEKAETSSFKTTSKEIEGNEANWMELFDLMEETKILPKETTKLPLEDENSKFIQTIPTKSTHPPSTHIKSDFFFSRGFLDTQVEAKKSDATLLSHYIPKEFYIQCNDGKGCFGDPKGCILQKSCEAAVSFQPDSERVGVVIELLGRTSKYIALGFSHDQLMGDDNVVECVREHEHVRIYRSFNSARHNNRLKDHSSIRNLKGNYNNDWLYCSFLLQKKTTVNTGTKKLTFDLEKEKFHLLLERGNVAQGNRIGVGLHDLGTAISKEKYNLMVDIGLRRAEKKKKREKETKIRKLFEKLHGISIIIAWIFILPVSTFVIRYFKDSCVEKFICGLSIWFAVHLILNGIVVGLTLAGMLLIMIPFPTKGTKPSSGWNHHNISALVLCILVIIQIGLGIGIYRMRDLNCLWLSKSHSIIGHLIFFFSYAIIYMSKEVRHGLPCNAHPVLITWSVLYFLIHIIISCQVCYVDYIQGAEASRIYSFGGLLPAQVTNIEPEPPGGTIKRVLLGSMFTIGLLSSSILVGLYGAGFADCVRSAEDSV